ncbi:ArsR family transcriptional regulator [Jiangella aurantiaca]|uniref:ArsR family transcriptional regulator n=1 Tax=Jiangella aurantiaca TaxID=2530373 RepID=A0A4R5A4X3_9ACTN|nr:winged helix-turn-helix domain-containing protein [Jiangella aurantiaca]TDD66585.1 ArsR family transcriptional regulator [Jiangella aurantiaca]
MPEAPRRHIDATTLRGLAHPLRVQLYDALVTFGPATATMLAGRFGESTGSTSYHLRQLAKHGFVEEDPGRGAGRERYWRAYPGGSQLDSYELAEGGSGEAASLVVGELQRAQSARLEHWLSVGYLQVPREWGQATINSTAHLRLLPDELASLGAELTAVLDAWHERVDSREPGADDARIVEVQIHTFPVAAQDVP